MGKAVSETNMEKYFVFERNDDNSSYNVLFCNTELIEQDKITTLVIPSTYKGLPVTSICHLAFSGDRMTKDVFVEKYGGTFNGKKAFIGDVFVGYDLGFDNIVNIIGVGKQSVMLKEDGQVESRISCGSVKSIVIPDSVTIIKKFAFFHCEFITSIIIGNGVETIERDAFNYCSSLTNIVIPDSVTNIGDDVFSDCSSLTDIVIPDSITNLGDYVFCRCHNVKTVYFKGTEAGWNKLNICENDIRFKNIPVYFYSEIPSGNSWHYAADGVTPEITHTSFVTKLRKLFSK